MGRPARHKTVRQSPALATKSLLWTIRATTAQQPGCQSFRITRFDSRQDSTSYLNAKSVSTNAFTNASAGLHFTYKYSCVKWMKRICVCDIESLGKWVNERGKSKIAEGKNLLLVAKACKNPGNARAENSAAAAPVCLSSDLHHYATIKYQREGNAEVQLV